MLLATAQNPDPKATNYFAEYITKAYQALTDEASRLNYEKYGHPDGPQVGVEGQGWRARGWGVEASGFRALVQRSMWLGEETRRPNTCQLRRCRCARVRRGGGLCHE